MSKIARRQRSHRVSRTAPPGYVVPVRRMDLAPDGWEPLNPSVRERALIHADSALLRTTRAVARGVTRREFLRRVGQVGLVVGMGTASVVLLPKPAYARCFACGDPCGSSPDCGQANCTNGNCKTSVGNKKRRHDNFDCFACGSGPCNCWTADCCFCGGSNSQKKQCCDCCSDADPNTCTTGCINNRACICNSSIGC